MYLRYNEAHMPKFSFLKQFQKWLKNLGNIFACGLSITSDNLPCTLFPDSNSITEGGPDRKAQRYSCHMV